MSLINWRKKQLNSQEKLVIYKSKSYTMPLTIPSGFTVYSRGSCYLQSDTQGIFIMSSMLSYTIYTYLGQYICIFNNYSSYSEIAKFIFTDPITRVPDTSYILMDSQSGKPILIGYLINGLYPPLWIGLGFALPNEYNTLSNQTTVTWVVDYMGQIRASLVIPESMANLPNSFNIYAPNLTWISLASPQ